MAREWWRGAVLRKARERRKLTQEALARKVGVHRLTIVRLETGTRRPSADLLRRLAKALGTRMEDLLR